MAQSKPFSLLSFQIMKPISLHGHERSITTVRYNRDGDLLFSSAKDHFPNVWYAINGERLGTYGTPGADKDPNSHGGAVWCLDVDWMTKYLVTGAADNSCRLWDVCTGKMLKCIDTKSAVRSCSISYSGYFVDLHRRQVHGQPCDIDVVGSPLTWRS